MEINDLGSAASVLHWDQATYMPSGGAAARARQLATLSRLRHEKFIDPAVGKLLEELRPFEMNLPFESDDASLIRVTRREYEKAVKVPSSFAAEFTAHSAASFAAWTVARQKNDFASVRPMLERTLELSRRLAEFYAPYEHIADPLIDFSDEGMTAAKVRALFSELRNELVPMARSITEQAPVDDSCLTQQYPEKLQEQFGLEAVKQIGYDFNRGRQDRTHHPFMTKFSLGDVRITTRFDEYDIREALFGTLHEGGHALYEQGIRMELEGTPLAGGTSAGVHESQSRLWENIVGRSRGFWKFFYPKLQETFPGQLGRVSLDTFYRAINRVKRSLIRTEADEITYNLHVLIRFEFELDLLEGKLAVKDLPEAWHARYQSDLGVRAPNDRDGVLQDVHWFGGGIGGAFHGYTLGNILAAQFFEAATKAKPEIPQLIESGEFATLHGWLRENIYQHGSKFTPEELVPRATGMPMSIAPYLRYLRGKYGDLYRL